MRFGLWFVRALDRSWRNDNILVLIRRSERLKGMGRLTESFDGSQRVFRFGLLLRKIKTDAGRSSWSYRD